MHKHRSAHQATNRNKIHKPHHDGDDYDDANDDDEIALYIGEP